MELEDDFNVFDDKPKKVIDTKGKDYQTTLNDLNEEYKDKACTFTDVEDIGKTILSTLPKLDFNKLRDEMSNMHVETFENPTTFQLSEEMAQVQEYKNRLSEIMNKVEHEYLVRKRVNDML